MKKKHYEKMTRMVNLDKIDFVMPWLDGSDPAWRAACAAYCAKKDEDAGEARFRDWGMLKYWFRGIEQYAPWVNRVHLITWGHLPVWLNTAHPKLNIVRHEDYIPAQYLPTFNSNPIELNMYRIKGLAEQFVYFNDDLLILDRLKPTDFFVKGKPCDMLALQPVICNPQNPVMSHIYLNNGLVLCRHFDKRANIKKQPQAYFRFGYPLQYFCYNALELAFPQITGFYTIHGPAPFLKASFEALWEQEKDILDATCGHRFRSEQDVNQYLVREWQKLNGNFCPRCVNRYFKYFNVQNTNPELVNTIVRHKKKMICVNDSETVDFERAKLELLAALEKALPEKSDFEK